MAESDDHRSLVVRRFGRNNLTFVNYPSNATVRQVKVLLHRLTDLPVEQQRLLFGGTLLEDSRKMQSYPLQQGTIVFLVLSKDTLPLPQTASSWERAAYIQLPEITLPPFTLPFGGDLTRADMYVWCTRHMHLPIGSDCSGKAYPSVA